MPSADLCTEKEIIQLMNRFYESIHKDNVLGPIVNPHVKDWDTHLTTTIAQNLWHGYQMNRDADKLVGVA